MSADVQKAKVWLASHGFDPDDERNVEWLTAAFRKVADQPPITPDACLPSPDCSCPCHTPGIEMSHVVACCNGPITPIPSGGGRGGADARGSDGPYDGTDC